MNKLKYHVLKRLIGKEDASFIKELQILKEMPLIKAILKRDEEDLRELVKKQTAPLIRWWCAYWVNDQCFVDESKECLAECFKYCPDCKKCYNRGNAFCLNDGNHPCLHFEFAEYPDPLTHSFSCISFSKGLCLKKNEFCRDISYEDCPRKIEEKKERELKE